MAPILLGHEALVLQIVAYTLLQVLGCYDLHIIVPMRVEAPVTLLLLHCHSLYYPIINLDKFLLEYMRIQKERCVLLNGRALFQ